MREVLDHYRSDIARSDAVERLGLRTDQYFLVSAHREENVDSPKRLTQLVETLQAVVREFGLPVIVSTHPRTRKRLEAFGSAHEDPMVRWLEPFGFHDYNKLQVDAACVLSDSGTISEESSILGFRAVTLRESIERPEALDTGSIIMAGLEPLSVVTAVRHRLDSPRVSPLPSGYDVPDTSMRVLRFILSTAERNAEWHGLRPR
jgi:UDP-N-acetylglucosamine 2-epimerase (non-hydrolysing)